MLNKTTLSAALLLLVLASSTAAMQLPQDFLDMQQQMHQRMDDFRQMRRHLSQAVASASSTAGPGETVISSSGATSQGQPTYSSVTATGSGPGTTVNCQQQAQNGQQLSKECGGAAPGVSSSGAVPAWRDAPACRQSLSNYRVVRDQQGNPWGYETDTKTSCALR